MTVLSGQTILRSGIIIDPQERTELTINGITTSFGISPCGYDLRIAETLTIEPGGFSLASAIEEFSLTKDIVGIVHDKSSWARRGIALQNTVIEPNWRGFLTLEITNHSEETIHISSGMGICQVIFHYLDESTQYPYEGKYQDQKAGPQNAK